jgi:hypothetical protein
MESVSLYSEARNEYIKQLSTWIVPPLVEFFRKEYATIAAREGRRVMTAFQTWCSEIPKWNQDVIDTHVGALLDSCRCDYVEELMTAVFIAHTKMLTAIRVSTKQKKLQITLPKLDHFLHRVFVECARSFWKAPFLFSEHAPLIEQQKNILQLETMCTEALSGAVRSLLPVKSILRDYLEDEDNESEEEAPKKTKKKSAPVPESESDSEPEVTPPVATETITETIAEPLVAETIAEPLDVKSKPDPEPLFAEPLEGGDRHSVPYVEQKTVVEVPKPIIVEKEPGLTISEILPEPMSFDIPAPTPAPTPAMESIEIDTTPSVRFSDYETVFDERSNTNEIRYAPKVSVEEMPPSAEDEWYPKLDISGVAESLGDIEIEDLDAPATAKPAQPAQPEEDVDISLTDCGEFEEL